MKARRTEIEKGARNESPESRAARIRAVVEKARAAGEQVPAGINLLGSREPTERERAFGATLEQHARECLARGKRVAA